MPVWLLKCRFSGPKCRFSKKKTKRERSSEIVGCLQHEVRHGTRGMSTRLRSYLQPKEYIHVYDSPKPTRTPSTPRSRSTLAQRSGGMRRPMPRRRTYRILYNPKAQGECGFDCILRIMKRRPTPFDRKAIRKVAAHSILWAYDNDLPVIGQSVRQLVYSIGLTSFEYAQSLQQGMWASPMDLSLCC